LAILLILGLKEWVAAIVAAIIGMSLSFIFLRKPRENVARDLYAARHRDQPLVHADAALEDSALNREEAQNARMHADAEADAAADAEPTPRNTAQ